MTTRARICVIMGQGDELTSAGMVALKARIAEHWQLRSHVTLHSWSDPSAIYRELKLYPRKDEWRHVLIGYSLGGNCASWVASGGGLIDLLIAYDPTARSFLPPIGEHVKRAICFWNSGAWVFGGGKMTGNVEVVETWDWHLHVQHDERLHKITFDAIAKVF